MRPSLVLAGVLVAAGLAVPQASAVSRPGPEQRMRAAAEGSVTVSRDEASGRVEFVRAGGSGDLAPGVSARSAKAADAKARDWLDDNAELFGVDVTQLVAAGQSSSEQGRTLTYTQEYRGLPVWGAALKVNLDADGDLRSVNGHVVPGIDVGTDASTTASRAGAAAVQQVLADPPTDDEGKPATIADPHTEATLVVYETGSPLGQAGAARLAWDVTVTAGDGVRERVILDAHQLKPLNRYSEAHAALERTLFSTDDRGTDSQVDDNTAQVWAEGQSTAALAADQKRLLATTEETYRFFQNAFGLDSYDDAGSAMVMLHHRANACPNASWDGVRTSYCPGVDSDDIVAHEWGHAYTEYSSGLIYQWQSGALNESYSDVWGETVDLLNDREDEGEVVAVRADDTCSGRTSDSGAVLDRTVQLTVTAPTARSCVGVEAHFGLRLTNAPQQIAIVAGTDASDSIGPSTTDGCSTLTNAAAVSGKWVLLDRGTCTFARKSRMAAAAGALGVLAAETTAEASIAAAGSGVLPLVRIAKADGDAIRAMSGAVTATLSSVRANDTTHDRWLLGEKSSGFGGAIRDMWNPTCLGNPAKVSDVQYTCDAKADSASDYGRVHSHSGVPNRAYSLFVDGGTFNEQTVTGVGLDKAAQVWWRANAAYLTPTSDFADFATALTESCRTLVGQPIAKLSTGAPAGTTTSVTTADCGELESVIAATELRTDMAERCGIGAYFPDDEPAGCGDGYVTQNLLSENFENGLGGFTPSRDEATNPGPAAWEVAHKLAGRSGSAAFAANPSSCSVEGESAAGRTSLTSPEVTISEGLSPRLSFRHRVYLEDGYDGGNVKLGVNGTWTTVPQEAWLANGPASTVLPWSAGENGDNPLLGERVWTGGRPQTGSSGWGVSVLDLEAAGVHAGDTVQVRFDLGTDKCVGSEGWYVDDVSISHCVEQVVPTTVPSSVPTTRPTTAPTKAPAVVKKATKVSVKASPGKPRKGKRFRLTATVAPRTSGTVTFTLDGRRLKAVKVVGGKATLTISAKQSRKLRKGKHVVRVTYAGNSVYKPSAGKRTFTVRK